MITYANAFGRYFWFQLFCVLYVFAIVIFLAYRYYGTPSKIRGLLVICFLCYGFSLCFSTIKVYYAYVLGWTTYFENEYYTLIIRDFRFSTIFTMIGNGFFFLFSQSAFLNRGQVSSKKEKKQILVLVLAIGSIVLALLPINSNIMLFITGGLTFLHSMIVFGPITIESWRLYKLVETQYKWGFYFLFLMASSFLISWLAYLANQIWDVITHLNYGPFYFVLWLSLLFSVTNAGCFLMPDWLKKRLKIVD